MSVVYKSNYSSLIDHGDYIFNLYKHVNTSENETLSFRLSTKLFYIVMKNTKGINRKRSHNSKAISEQSLMLQSKYKVFLSEMDSDLKQNIYQKYNILDMQNVRDFSKELSESTIFNHMGLNGGNNSDNPLKCVVKGDYFLIPQKSRFFCGCVKEECLKLEGSKYDIVIADPPWWNKYIRRLKGSNDKLSYSMMYNEDIAAIPVKDLLSPSCLIAIWCTNSPSNIAAVTDMIFPSWGVEYLTTWYWLKVTVDLEPICAFSPDCGKQPYERLILGKTGEVKELPDSYLFVSVPSALHSHKPPVIELLKPYVKTENPQVLELFARYLLPNTTSIGYEPLKLQHLSLYETVT